MHTPLLRTLFASVALLLATATGALAAEPVVWRTDYTSARKEAEEKKLPILVVVGTDQCVYCRKLEASTFADKDVLAMLAGKVVLLKVDANKDPEFARAMRVTIYPTTVIAGTDGKVFAYLAGYVSPEQFREHAAKSFDLIVAAELKEKPKNDAVLTARVKPDPKADPPAEALKVSIDEVKAALKAERIAEAMERATAVAVSYPNTPAGEQAVGILAAIKADPAKLARAAEQLDEKLAAGYFAIAEAFEQKGKVKEALTYFEKVIVAAPGSTHAERAKVRVAAISRSK
jgi:thioredoxin-related protein